MALDGFVRALYIMVYTGILYCNIMNNYDVNHYDIYDYKILILNEIKKMFWLHTPS